VEAERKRSRRPKVFETLRECGVTGSCGAHSVSLRRPETNLARDMTTDSSPVRAPRDPVPTGKRTSGTEPPSRVEPPLQPVASRTWVLPNVLRITCRTALRNQLAFYHGPRGSVRCMRLLGASSRAGVHNHSSVSSKEAAATVAKQGRARRRSPPWSLCAGFRRSARLGSGSPLSTVVWSRRSKRSGHVRKRPRVATPSKAWSS